VKLELKLKVETSINYDIIDLITIFETEIKAHNLIADKSSDNWNVIACSIVQESIWHIILAKVYLILATGQIIGTQWPE